MQIYTNIVIGGLRDLADTDFQHRVWPGHSPSEMSSFVECVEQIFDDSGLDAAMRRMTVFDQEIDALLVDLGDLTDSVDDSQPTNVLLEDPNLRRCRELAAKILTMIGERAS